MSELDKLISSCQEYIKTNDPCIKTVKRPQLLIKYLKELRDDIIGLDKIKDSIATQIMYLITKDSNSGTHMLHSVIYGSAGVGKSSIGVKLAKIWYALGFLETSTAKSPVNIQSAMNMDDIPMNINFAKKSGVNVEAVSLILLCIYVLSSIVKSGMSSYGWYVLVLFGVGLLIYGLYVMTKNKMAKTTVSSGANSNKNLNSTTATATTTASTKTNKTQNDPDDVDDTTIIKVVSRSDFVAGFLGQTALKTKRLLAENLGKVLFIDEAYSLINDDRDSFGMEALTTLNLFMSENPDKIVCIFAGYKNLLQNGVFKHQPGLVRRCMWHFECDGYTPDELFKIFKLQVTKNGKKLTNEARTLELITQHYDVFTSYAGDTEKLVFFAQLEATRDKFNTTNSNSTNNITPKHIEIGITKLRENNINKDTSSSKSTFEKLLDEYSKREIMT